MVNETAKNIIKTELTNNPNLNQTEIAQSLKDSMNLEVHRSTISRFLKDEGVYKNPISRPIISLKNKEKRLDYSKFHSNDIFPNIIFLDESYFELNRKTKKMFVFKGNLDNEINYYNPNHKIGVWGAISRKGKIGFTLLNSTVNKEYYVEILEENLLAKANSTYGCNRWRFQQDNAPAHKSYYVKEWLGQNVPGMINHPPQSPDLNPIEHIWSSMKSEVENRKPKNKEELIKYVKLAWENVSNNMINNCIDHHMKIIKKIIETDAVILDKKFNSFFIL